MFRLRYLYISLFVLGISMVFTNAFFAWAETATTTVEIASSTSTINSVSVVNEKTKAEVDALNAEIKEKQDKIKELESTMEVYRKALVEKQTEVSSLKNQLGILDNRVAEIQTDIDLTKEKIKQTQLEIDALNLTIADKEKTIARQKKIIAKMVENIHSSDQKNYIEIMLTYNNFSDFYNELKSTENVYVDLGQSVKMLRIAKEELDARKAQVVTKKEAYANLQNQLEAKKGNLVQQQVAKQQILTDTRSSEAKYQTMLGNLKQQYNQIQSEQKAAEDKLKQKLKTEDKIFAGTDLKISWPVPSHIVNSHFHDKDYPFKGVFEHSGTDIKAPQGTAIRAGAAGYVAKARRCTTASCYAYVLIVHTTSISTVYGHMSAINVQEGQYVNRGDIIGASGGTPKTVGAGPFVTGPHLHFEVRLNGIPVDAEPYLE